MAAKTSGRKSGAKSARKGSARKSARKSTERTADDRAADSAASLLEEKGEEARELATSEEAPEGNILGSDPLGPSMEHEDHEGAETDSLTKRGARGLIPRAEDMDDDERELAHVRAPSVRERQLRRGGGRGGYVRPRDAVSALAAENEEPEVVRVVATDQGFYRNKRRHRGDVFDYALSDAEEGLLPSWVEAADGSVESRRKGQVVGVQASTIIEVHPTGGATVREGARTTTTPTGISGRANAETAGAARRRTAAADAGGARSGRKSTTSRTR